VAWIAQHVDQWPKARHAAQRRDYSAGPLVITFFVGLFGMSLLLSGFVSYWWGDAINDGTHSGRGPLALQIVVPAARAVILSGDGHGCGDRVGSTVVVGSDVTVVLTEWDRFVVDDCERGNLSDLFPELTPQAPYAGRQVRTPATASTWMTSEDETGTPAASALRRS